MNAFRISAAARLQRYTGARHENLSADHAHRYPFDRDSLHFGARTAFEDAPAIAVPVWRAIFKVLPTAISPFRPK
jgi:hypothetical protein